jgi:hypothetical protein
VAAANDSITRELSEEIAAIRNDLKTLRMT